MTLPRFGIAESRLIGAALAAVVLVGPVRADTLHVPADYATIQSAIDAASDDDTVLVEAGTYVERIDLRGKAIVVRSTDGPSMTTIDGSATSGSVVTMTSGEGPGTVIDGFRITGGTGTRLYFSVSGGGFFLLDAAPTVMDCVVEHNEADHGGGWFNRGGATAVIACTFRENTAFCGAGGLDATDSGLLIVDSTFEANRAQYVGGAMDLNGGDVALVNCEFIENIVADEYDGVGGAIASSARTLVATGCQFDGNHAWEAGAVHAGGYAYETRFEDCVFTRNTALYAGAIKSGVGLSITLERCTLAENAAVVAGALEACGGTVSMRACTLIGNTAESAGGAIYTCGASLAIDQCVLAGNTAGERGGAINCQDTSTRIERCVFTDNVAAGGGAVFASERPTVASSTFCGNEPDDIEGDYTDGGENDFCCPADLDESGAVDAGDIFAILAAWGPCGGCPEDLDEDGTAGMSDVLVVLVTWGACP